MSLPQKSVRGNILFRAEIGLRRLRLRAGQVPGAQGSIFPAQQVLIKSLAKLDPFGASGSSALEGSS
jgi:hypothetical protein